MIPLQSAITDSRQSAHASRWLITTTEQTWYAKNGKRLFDVLVALFVCLFVMTWLVPLVGIAVGISSRGPIFFIQMRTGRKGRTFNCFKFRTMIHQPRTVFKQAVRDDVRITRVGRFLRQTNLDEMPQFLNVLFGDMSVVGPRPHAVDHDAQYWSQIDSYQYRYSVRPGITGLAQTRGARGDTSELIRMRHRLKYDLHYMKRQSFLLDVHLCWLTFTQMLVGSVNAW